MQVAEQIGATFSVCTSAETGDGITEGMCNATFETNARQYNCLKDLILFTHVDPTKSIF